MAELKLSVRGQGVLLFTAGGDTCAFVLTSSAESKLESKLDESDCLLVAWTGSGVSVRRRSAPEPYPGANTGKGLVADARAFYWFSLDAQNCRLRAGVGEARAETAVYECKLPAATDAERRESKAFLESLTGFGAFTGAAPLRLLRDPVGRAPPLRVEPSATLDALAAGLHLPATHLAPVARQMFDCVAGCRLDTDDFPEFSRAVAASIAGGWCRKRLAEKADEFSKTDPNPAETYLRITLGENTGESPGVPYVLEIWPAGHFSPTHSHANAEAIIKVLHGDIEVQLYPYLGPSAAPFAITEFTAGDVMWISPTLNQVHRLTNRGAEPCVTIQCYTYDRGDRAHYDFFDYLDKSVVKQYTPDSDMEFSAFKALMRTEWESAANGSAARGPLACFGF